MQLRVPILKNFEFGGPQQWAALMLLALFSFSCWSALITPVGDSAQQLQFKPGQLRDSVLEYDIQKFWQPTVAIVRGSGPGSRLWLRLPFIAFGLWLGGALWWVTRRLYNNAGGYVALALYCSSAAIVAASSWANAEILAAWGFFGIIYTAIGVAHTLYAPPAKWRPRILLLGTAFGLTAASHLSAAILGFILAAFFMLYLAPGRRLASAAILLIGAAIAAVILWALYGFGAQVTALAWPKELHIGTHEALVQFLQRQFRPLLCLVFLSLAIFTSWRRTRYFGNWTPLLVVSLLALLITPQAEPLFWALPFVFVFVGGIASDVLETRWRVPAILLIALAIFTQTVILLLALARANY